MKKYYYNCPREFANDIAPSVPEQREKPAHLSVQADPFIISIKHLYP